jgi:hypothetical protein
MTLRGERVSASKLGTQRSGCAQSQKKCEACGETFACGAPQRGCWCEGVKLTSEAAALLRARHTIFCALAASRLLLAQRLIELSQMKRAPTGLLEKF